MQAWTELSSSYLQQRRTLKLVLVVVDARVGLKQSDLTLLQYLEAHKVRYTLVLTKADAAGTPKRVAQIVSLVQRSVGRARHLQKPIAVVSSRRGGGIGRLQRRCIEVTTGVDPLAHIDGGWDPRTRAHAAGSQHAGRGGAATAPARGRGRVAGGTTAGRQGRRGATGAAGALGYRPSGRGRAERAAVCEITRGGGWKLDGKTEPRDATVRRGQ